MLWNLVLHHIPVQRIKSLKKHPYYASVLRHLPQKQIPFTCGPCAFGKKAKAPHRPGSNQKYARGEVICIDTFGALPPTGSQNTTILTLLDVGSRYLISVHARSRSEAAKVIPVVLTHIKHIRGKPPHIVISDNAAESLSNYIRDNVARFGTQLMPMGPHNPQENSLNERDHRTIMDATRAILFTAKLSGALWAEAVLDATFKYNMLPHIFPIAPPTPLYFNYGKEQKIYLRLFSNSAKSAWFHYMRPKTSWTRDIQQYVICTASISVMR